MFVICWSSFVWNSDLKLLCLFNTLFSQTIKNHLQVGWNNYTWFKWVESAYFQEIHKQRVVFMVSGVHHTWSGCSWALHTVSKLLMQTKYVLLLLFHIKSTSKKIQKRSNIVLTAIVHQHFQHFLVSRAFSYFGKWVMEQDAAARVAAFRWRKWPGATLLTSPGHNGQKSRLKQSRPLWDARLKSSSVLPTAVCHVEFQFESCSSYSWAKIDSENMYWYIT